MKNFSLIICAVMFLNLFTGCGGSDKYLGITPKNFVENCNKQLKPLSEAKKMNLTKYKITGEKQGNDGNIFLSTSKFPLQCNRQS